MLSLIASLGTLSLLMSFQKSLPAVAVLVPEVRLSILLFFCPSPITKTGTNKGSSDRERYNDSTDRDRFEDRKATNHNHS